MSGGPAIVPEVRQEAASMLAMARLRRASFAAALLLIPIALLTACGTPAHGAPAARPFRQPTPGAGDTLETIQVGGRERTYRLHAPPALSGSPALVLALHGAGSNGVGTARLTHLSAVADREGF